MGAMVCCAVLGVWALGTRRQQITVASKEPGLVTKGGHVVDRNGQRYFMRAEWDFWELREGDTFTCVVTELPWSTPHLLHCSEADR